MYQVAEGKGVCASPDLSGHAYPISFAWYQALHAASLVGVADVARCSLQDRWFVFNTQWQGQLQAAVRTLKSLPIFEVAARPEGADASVPEELAMFVSLEDASIHLAPSQVPAGTLTASCLAPGSYREREALLRHLQIKQWSLSQFYR